MKKLNVKRLIQVLSTALILYPVSFTHAEQYSDDINEFICLYDNLYHEARGEGKAGLQAVANVTINRTKSSYFPSTICQVVYQPGQFSWTKKSRKKQSKLQNDVYQVTSSVFENKIRDNTGGAMWFHTTSTAPSWALEKQQTRVIKNHVYYKQGKKR